MSVLTRGTPDTRRMHTFMSQLHLQLESLELVGRSSLDLLAHSLVRPLLHAVESLADIHFGGIVVVCLLRKSRESRVCVYSRWKDKLARVLRSGK